MCRQPFADRNLELAMLLVTPLGGGMYRLHPALPAYLVGAWRRMANAGYAGEHAATERALVTAYAAFATWLTQQIQSG